MAAISFKRSSLENFNKYNSLLVGNAFTPPPAESAYDLLETEILASNAASVEFTGLGAYSDYKHLQIRMTMRTSTSTLDFLTVKVNDTNLSNRHFLQGNGSTVSSGESSSVLDFGSIPKSDSASGVFSVSVLDYIDAFSTLKNKTIRLFSGNTIGTFVALQSGLQVSTSATESITLDLFNSTSFATGSRFSLYGLKAGA